jgi:hypothetical protein
VAGIICQALPQTRSPPAADAAGTSVHTILPVVLLYDPTSTASTPSMNVYASDTHAPVVGSLPTRAPSGQHPSHDHRSAACPMLASNARHQGLTLVRFSAQRKQVLWDIYICWVVSGTNTAQIEVRSGRLEAPARQSSVPVDVSEHADT